MMSCEGRIVTEYSIWKPLFVPRHFMAALCALSGHVGHIYGRWNNGGFCETRAPAETKAK